MSLENPVDVLPKVRRSSAALVAEVAQVKALHIAAVCGGYIKLSVPLELEAVAQLVGKRSAHGDGFDGRRESVFHVHRNGRKNL